MTVVIFLVLLKNHDSGTVESEIYDRLAKVRRKQERKSIGGEFTQTQLPTPAVNQADVIEIIESDPE